MYIFDILFAVDFGNDMSQKQSYAKQNKGKKHLLFFFFPLYFRKYGTQISEAFL